MKQRLTMVLTVLTFIFCSQILYAQSVKKMEKKLNSIIIEHMEVEDASVEAVIKLIRFQAKQSDPDKKGINIVTFLEDPNKKKETKDKEKSEKEDVDILLDEDLSEEERVKETKSEKTVTMMFDDLSLYDVIKNICMVADLKYRVEDYAVVIAHKDFPLDPFKTKIYPVSRDVFDEVKKRLKK